MVRIRGFFGGVTIWVFLSAFALGALSLCLAGLARSPATRDWVREQLSAVIARELGVRATFSDVDLVPQSFSVMARGISLDHPDGGRLLDAAELRIRPSWRSLLSGQLDLNVVSVDRATLWLKLRDGQLVNAPTLPETSSADEDELDLPLNVFSLRHARVVIDAEPDATAEFSDIDVELASGHDGVIGVRAIVGSGFVHHARGDEHLLKAEVRATVSKRQLAIEYASVETADASLAVQQASLNFPLLEAPYRGQVDANLSLAATARLPAVGALPDLRGEVSVSGQVAGRGKEPRVDAEVALRRVYIDGFGLGEQVVVQVQADAERIEYNAVFDAVDDGGQLVIDGELALKEPGAPLRAEARVDHVAFAKLMKQLGVSDNAIVDWDLNGRFELAGTTSPLQLRGAMHFDTRAFHITRDAYHQRPQKSILFIERALLDGGVRVTEAGISFIDVDATLPHSRLEVAEVLLGFDNALRVRAQGTGVDLRDVSPLVDFDLDGQGNFAVQVLGTFTAPVVAGNAHFKRFAFADFPFGDITTDYHLERDSQAVRFTDAVIVKNDSRYHTDSLFMDFSAGRLLIESQLRFEPLVMKDFYKIFHYDQDERFESYQGYMEGPVAVRYTLGFPGDKLSGTLLVDLDVDVPEAILDGYRFEHGHFDGSWHWFDHEKGYEGGVLTVRRLDMKKGAGTVHVSGQMRRGGTLDFVVLGDRVHIKDTEGLSERMVGLSGAYGVTGTVRGTLSRPRADLDLLGSGLRFDGKPLGLSRAYVRLTDKQDPWIIEAGQWTEAEREQAPCGHGRYGLWSGVWPADPPLRVQGGFEPALEQPMAFVMCGSAIGGQLVVDMALGRTAIIPLRGRLTFNDLDIGRFLPKVQHQAATSGTVTGTLDFDDGGALEPTGLGGKLYLSSLQAGQLSLKLSNDGPISLRFGHGSMEVEHAALVGPSSHLRLQGGGSTRSGLSLTVDGGVDLALLSPFVGQLTSAEGRLELKFNLAGSLSAPKVYGKAQLSDAAFAVEGLPTPITGVRGDVVFSEHRVLVENFNAHVSGGDLRMSGSAALAGRGLGSYQLRLAVSDMHLRPKEQIDMRFGGEGLLAWQEGERLPKLTGTLRLHRLFYGRDIQIGQSLQDIYRADRAEVATYAPDNDHLEVDLLIEETRPLRIENNLIEADLVLDKSRQPFRIVGTDQRVGVLGNMSVRRGSLRFRGTTFDVREGEVRFADPTRVVPAFDLRAVTDVRRKGRLGQDQWHIVLHAWGSRDEFRWELSSDPHLSEDDIALMLTVGMTHAELAQLETGELTSTAALEALATVTGVEREVKRALPTIDEFRVQSGYTYSESRIRTEPQLYIGKRIADRVRLSATTGVGQTRDFRAGVELQVSDKTSVQAVYSNQNATSASQLSDVGVDLKWRLEFD